MALQLIKIDQFPQVTIPENWIVVAKADGIAYKISKEDFKAWLGTVQSVPPKPISPSDPVPTLAGLYIPTENGSYPGGITVDLSDGYNQLVFDGSSWSKVVTPIDLTGYVPKTPLDYFVEGKQPADVTDSFEFSDSRMESGILNQSNGIVGSSSYYTMRNYLVGSSKFLRMNVSALHGNLSTCFLLGITSGGSNVVVIDSTQGRIDRTIDLTGFARVSFSLGANSYAKFYNSLPVESRDVVKSYIDNIGEGLGPFLPNTETVETLINGGYVGKGLLVDRILRENGSISSGAGIRIIHRYDVRKQVSVDVELPLLGSGGGTFKNAGILGYKSDNSIIDMYPLPTTGGTLLVQTFDISDYDYISFCFSLASSAQFKATFTGKGDADGYIPLKEYIDNAAGKSSLFSTTHPTFTLTRKGSIFTSGASSLPSICWPWIIVTDRIASPLGKYYMYYSTDHAGNSGRIAAAFSDNLISWTEYGVILTALDQIGVTTEAETPSVVYDEYSGKFRMYWQCQADINGMGYAQSTMISESTDGLNWTFVKEALDIPLNFITGDGHNGYFSPIKVGNQYIASHLMGGTAQNYSTVSYSYDGLNWWTRRDITSAQLHGSFASDVYSGGQSGDCKFIYNGNVYAVSGIGIPAFGTNPKVQNLGITQFCDDYASILGKAELLLVMDSGLNENNDIRSVSFFQDTDGKAYVIYNCNNRFFLAELNKR